MTSRICRLLFPILLVACESTYSLLSYPPPPIQGSFRDHGALDIVVDGSTVCGKWPGGEAYCTRTYRTNEYWPRHWLSNTDQITFGGYDAFFDVCVRSNAGTVRCGWELDKTEKESGMSEVFGLQNDIVDIGGGAAHTCAVRANGTVRCWGKNGYGELGDGTTLDCKEPVTVKGLTDVIDVSVYGDSNCALRKSGAVKCWGKNDYGQLGDGTEEVRKVPTDVKGVSRATAIGVGGTLGCALIDDGTVQCWGKDKPGLDKKNEAEPVPLLEGVAAITVGDTHACARLVNGRVRCWGQNQYGQLGDGSRLDYRSIPSFVEGITDAVQIATGSMSTCARLVTGAVRCWGSGSEPHARLLGASDSEGYAQVDIEPANQLVIGYHHSCALTKRGQVYCWGDDTYGQLGDGKQIIRSRPVQVPDLDNVVQIAATDSRTCARKSDGTFWCWGGAVGPRDSDRTPLRPRPEKIIDDVDDFVLSGKRMYSRIDTCVIRRDGSVWCWIDDPVLDRAKVSAPKLVSGLSGVVKIALEGNYPCALLKNGEVRCWGDDFTKRIENDSMVSADQLVTVRDLPPIVRMSKTGCAMCGATKDDREYCWGVRGREGERERHVGEIRAQPFEKMQAKEPVCFPPRSNWSRNQALQGLREAYERSKDATQLVFGIDHACMLRRDGTIVCAGYTQFGQIGNGVVHGEWMAE